MEQTGVVKWFHRVKGWGFILHPAGSPDVFVHYSAIDMDGYRILEEGERVAFELINADRGPQARNVRRLEQGSA
jgi:CspA family cold shock protein